MARPLRVVPFEPWHYVYATRDSEDRTTANRAGAIYGRHPAFTAFTEDLEIAGCAGVFVPYPGLGQAWAYITWAGRQEGRALAWAMRRGLRAILRDRAFRRVEAEAVADNGPAVRLLLALGFHVEHVVPRYGPNGEDFVRCVQFPGRRADASVRAQEAQERVVTPDGRVLVPIRGGYGSEAAAIIAIVGAVAAVAGTAVATYSAYQQGEAQAKAAKYNAKVAENQAQSAQMAATAEADQQRERYRRLLSTNEANVGASGVVADVGSPLLVMADNAAQAELNARLTEWQGQTRATGIRSEIPLLQAQAEQARTAGTLGAAQTLLAGAANLSSRAYSYWGPTTSPASAPTASSWDFTGRPAWSTYRAGERF